MKVIILILFTALMTVLEANARTLQEIQSSGVIRVAVDGATPPFNYYKDKSLVGFEVDLAAELAKKLGVKVEWVVKPFNTLLIAMNPDQNRFDLIATSHAVTPQRQSIVDFVDPHYCTGAIIVSKPTGPKTVADLAGKTVVVPVGTVYFDQLKKIPGIKEIRTVPNEVDGLQTLLGDRADAWVTEQFVAFEAIQNHKNTKIYTGEVILKQVNAMVVAKGNSTLLNAINKELKSLFSDGSYNKLSLKYFNRDIRCK